MNHITRRPLKIKSLMSRLIKMIHVSLLEVLLVEAPLRHKGVKHIREEFFYAKSNIIFVLGEIMGHYRGRFNNILVCKYV